MPIHVMRGDCCVTDCAPPPCSNAVRISFSVWFRNNSSPRAGHLGVACTAPLSHRGYSQKLVLELTLDREVVPQVKARQTREPRFRKRLQNTTTISVLSTKLVVGKVEVDQGREDVEGARQASAASRDTRNRLVFQSGRWRGIGFVCCGDVQSV